MNILETIDLKKYYGSEPNITRALDGVSLTIAAGEFVAIVGTSGSGKSTLLNMIGGLDVPTSGKVIVDGKDLSSMNDEQLTIFRRRKIGFVFQNYNLVPVLNVYENIVLPVELDGDSVDKKFMQDVVRMLALEDKLNSMPNNLSGGQQQRVALGRALVAEPKLLLLDEPLSNLDAKLRESMRYEIKEIQKKLHITVVYVTHDQIEAMTMSDRVFIINRGIVQQVGTPLEIYRHPANQFVADFVGKVNFVKGTAERGIVRLKGIDQSLSYNGPLTGDVIVAIRPENIQLTEAEGHLRGKLASMFYLGDVNDCRVDIGNTELRVTADSMTYDTLQAGADVGLVLQDFLVYPDDGDEDFNKILT